ncbi:MAG: DnaJ domain-containing protein [Cyanobacteria bacterium]|nr:DnaJ domain-containing protein [Cyanobacteriota bacterium]MDA0867883.1 DnaJ domain-containing protein [Cyanobacteriota bacterium]
MSLSPASNPYQILEIRETATQAEIKQAYRRLAKQLHPDSRNHGASHDRITLLNAAYEVLGDPQLRSDYDLQRRIQQAGFNSEQELRDRAERVAHSQQHYRQRRQATQSADTALDYWLRQVYNPVDRYVAKILSPLKSQIRALSADPFDDELMADFQSYLEDCQDLLAKAQAKFQACPNPGNAAAIAATLYHCLHQLEDGIEEMERYTYCYDANYLHMGQELFRIATQLRRDAKAQLQGMF